MSAWRRTALETLPEYRQTVADAENPMAMWIDLYLHFKDLYVADELNDELIGRFFKYARWCIQSPGEGRFLSDAGTAAVCAFYEHLPETEMIRRDLPRRLTREEFIGLREAFRYHLSEDKFRELEAEFLDGISNATSH